MQVVSRGVAYVRNHHLFSPDTAFEEAVHVEAHAGDTELQLRIWELLKTPHTVRSLRRALSREDEPSPSDEQVAEVLQELYTADLIEWSPDT